MHGNPWETPLQTLSKRAWSFDIWEKLENHFVLLCIKVSVSRISTR